MQTFPLIRRRRLLAHPSFTSQSAPEETFLAPGDFAAIYNTTPLVSSGNDGTGVSIAIVAAPILASPMLKRSAPSLDCLTTIPP